ncbi:hypothetical protein K402DRAFT_70852 [Aulographum hederae CBS 113979]|uniref:Uncharacterized protein n=1 Tax=Aulographum hederae CBS 113979 TaxID=1176131 RepID=A0A6G1HFK6_9PEZI|nr:hypothetical protein K402DRAFT_70852 [Aulographum hederae CBS 113979]
MYGGPSCRWQRVVDQMALHTYHLPRHMEQLYKSTVSGMWRLKEPVQRQLAILAGFWFIQFHFLGLCWIKLLLAVEAQGSKTPGLPERTRMPTNVAPRSTVLCPRGPRLVLE